MCNKNIKDYLTRVTHVDNTKYNYMFNNTIYIPHEKNKSPQFINHKI